MALTPDDVVTKQFQHVRFKEGFDPDEVDDFLDEIVVEWRKTIAENDELKAKLAAYESGDQAPAAASAEVIEEVPAAAPAPVQASDAGQGAAAPAAASAGIIELAQRLHDEHVSAGESRRDELVRDAQARHDELVADRDRDPQGGADGEVRQQPCQEHGRQRQPVLAGAVQPPRKRRRFPGGTAPGPAHPRLRRR